MESIWQATATLPERAPLRGDRQTEVLVIGGGMAGLLTAQLLQKAGVAVIVAEAETVCGGITKNTSAKITAQHGLVYHKLMQQFGPERARQYLDANEKAVAQLRALCQKFPCDFAEQDAYVYSLAQRKKLEDEAAALEKLGRPVELVEKPELPFPVAGALRFPRQGQFHPLAFAQGLSRDLPIYEHTRVLELKKNLAITAGGSIRAKHIVVATHFPFLNKHGSYFLKLYQHRTYMLALENGPQLNGMYVDEAEVGLSFRNYKQYLLLGGGDHRTGKPGGAWQELEGVARRYYPQAQARYRWATQDCMSLDSVPYIGPYSSRTPGLFVATGFNKWGMSSSMVAATVLRDLILERPNPHQEVFSPSRSILRPQLAANALEATASLLTPSVKRCPHLGCALKWNRAEHSWDCPCHGSRFTEDGRLIDNPATGDCRWERD